MPFQDYKKIQNFLGGDKPPPLPDLTSIAENETTAVSPLAAAKFPATLMT